MNPPNDPHAIIEINRPDKTGGEALIIWDSWQQERLFEKVSVELTTNESSMAEWTFFDPNFRIIDSYSGAEAIPMATIRVFIGYGQNLGEPVFKGLLAHVERGQSSTSFIAYDMGFKMKLLKRAGYKNKKDDLAILKTLAERNGLKFEGPEKPLKLEPHRAVMQDEQTDWEWATERARDAGLVLFVRHDTLFAKYPAKVGEPKMTLTNRQDFELQRDFDFTYRTPESQEGRPKVVKRRGRGRGGKRLEGKSDESSRGREQIVLKNDVPGKATKSKLSKRAQAQKELEREHAFQAHIPSLRPFDNDLRLDVRDTVRVLEVGKLFSGDYVCDVVRYDFAPGKNRMSLDLYRDIKNG